MDQEAKVKLYTDATNHLGHVISALKDTLEAVVQRNSTIKASLAKVNDDDKMVQQKLLEHGVAREGEIETLIPSPYFTRCTVSFGSTTDILYFGKFTALEQGIYSWVTPAASVRFKSPGAVSYTRPDGMYRNGVLEEKEQYMITEGRIVYMSTEGLGQPRELVYQEYFSNQKKDFVLPEIVAQMEAAQDAVIRADYRGPMVISGPAGSGKTTLALHRLAYLAQSPDVSDLFRPKDMIVFVQDAGTKEYFSQLLPDLGIRGVTITTFAEWAMNVLGLTKEPYRFRIGNTEEERDIYEFMKREALSKLSTQPYQDDIFALLEQIYTPYITEETASIWDGQKKHRMLDRFDLTILLMLLKKQDGQLTMLQEYLQVKKGTNEVIRKMGRFPTIYSLVMFDEFQNYLPEQIRLMKSTLDETHAAVMYVGDVAQQTQIGTLQNWSEIPEQILEARKVVLQKVYRNTKQILAYIRSLGYAIQIGNQARNGEEVVEVVCQSVAEEVSYVHELVRDTTNTVGVLCHDPQYLVPFRSAFSKITHVHILSMHEAQGVEFDVVCIVGVRRGMFDVTHVPQVHQVEKQRVHRDLLYVALTRAMNQLHILGSTTLRDMIQ